MRAVKRSHIGLRRKTNEDNCGIFTDLGLLAVADGMGGHMAGEVASKMALDLVDEFLRPRSGQLFANPRESLQEAILFANNGIFERARGSNEYQGMGTTITLAFIQNHQALIAHIGDSRAYLIRKGEVTLITSDHSLVNELLKNGGITSEEAKNHPHKNVLTRAMGAAPDLKVDFYEVDLQKGDILLLCTDGLSNLVTAPELAEQFVLSNDLEEVADQLIKLALERGGLDNISLVMGVFD